MSIDDNVNKAYREMTLKDFNLDKPYSEIPLRQKAFDLTGVPGVYSIVKDYSKNYVNSLLKGHSKPKAIGNWALQWSTGLATFAYGFLPLKEYLQSSISNIVGAYSGLGSGGSEILGGSLISQIAATIAPYLPTTFLGLPIMYYGMKRHNPVIVGAGAAFSFGSIAAGYDIFPYLSSLLAPITSVPIFPLIGAALVVGGIYRVAMRFARPFIKKLFDSYKEPDVKKEPTPTPTPQPEPALQPT